jgi:guanylate kinase
MLILTGPSASGKTEVAKILIEKYHLQKFITYTTRPIRVNEVDGVDYHFVSVDKFLKMKQDEEFIETTYYNNNHYGSRKLDCSNDKVVILDPSGVNRFYQALKDQIVSVYLETPEDIRRKRMMERLDKEELIERRLTSDREVFMKQNYDNIDYVVKNHDIDIDYLATCIYKLYKNSKNLDSK